MANIQGLRGFTVPRGGVSREFSEEWVPNEAFGVVVGIWAKAAFISGVVHAFSGSPVLKPRETLRVERHRHVHESARPHHIESRQGGDRASELWRV